MPGAYSTFDTLSMELGEMGPPGLVAPTKPLPVLARISLIERQRDPSAVHHQLEGAHTTSGPKHPQLLPAAVNFVIQTDGPETDAPADESTAEETEAGSPITQRVDQPQHQPVPQPQPAAEPLAEPPAAKPQAEMPQAETWVDTVLRIEAAIAPYSQIIVLITLLAAASLTLVLLRGEDKSLESGSPKSTTSSTDSSLASNLAADTKPDQLDSIELEKIELEPSIPNAEGNGAEGDDRKTSVEKVAARATGPVGVAPATDVTPAVEPVEPHRVAAAEPGDSDESAKPVKEKVRVALTPPPYPSTDSGAASGDRPQARLQGHVTPYRQ